MFLVKNLQGQIKTYNFARRKTLLPIYEEKSFVNKQKSII